MANITKVPNGPLIKKTGKFKGSTLKTGGTIKKVQNEDSLSPYMRKRAEADVKRAEIAKLRAADTKKVMNAKGFNSVEELRAWSAKNSKNQDVSQEGLRGMGNDKPGCSGSAKKNEKRLKDERNRKNGGPIAKMKKDGSVKNVSAGPSKKTTIASKVAPKSAYTKVQQRTLGNMKSGGKMKKNKTC